MKFKRNTVVDAAIHLSTTAAFALFASAATAQGSLDVDLDAAERALERTLALTGNLLLDEGRFEVTSSLGYSFSDVTPFGTDARFRFDRVTADVELRYGLPFDAQLELGIPYVYVTQRIDSTLAESSKDTGSGIGNARIGIAKTLVRESGMRPDIIGRVTYQSTSGTGSDNGVNISSDVEEVSVSISALKRMDPLALTGRLSYDHAYESDDGFDAGDTIGIGFGATLAASPTTSISVGIDAAWSEDARFDGAEIANSATNFAAINVGVSQVLNRSTLANVNFGAGLTEDSPDYFLGISFTTRLGSR